MQDDIFVIDSVVHPLNMAEANFADAKYCEPINAFVCGLLAAAPTPYAIDAAAAARDWSVDEVANLLFRESHTDVAVLHTTPIFFYKDGLSSFEKSVDAVTRYPTRFIGAYASVDPLRPDALQELNRQAEILGPVKMMGLKLYPVSYQAGNFSPWYMDDPRVAFPLYERAGELGIKNIAVHKSLPPGPAPASAFGPQDVEGAAVAFPDLNFEIVHGGISFTEETAWLFARFPNIYINLETLNLIMALRPRVFAEILAGLLNNSGEPGIERLIWAQGAMNNHPKMCLDAFLDFNFPDDVLARFGLYAEIPQLTHKHKQMILGENFAKQHGLQIGDLQAAIENDEFAAAQQAGLASPWSTTQAAETVLSRASAPAPVGVGPGV